MLYCLFSLIASALASVGTVNAVEIGSKAYLAGSHLRQDGANCAGQILMHG